MTKTLSVMFDGNVLRPDEPLDLEPNRQYQVTIQEVPLPNLEAVAPMADDKDAWDVLEEMMGEYDGPEDWSAEHDHYLYGTPKRQVKLADE